MVQHYGQLFHVIQRQTQYMATLARLVKLGEIDNLLQTVMFTLYGNQYDDEEEHLLLSMFQVICGYREFHSLQFKKNILLCFCIFSSLHFSSSDRGYFNSNLTNPLESELL